jgi:hypothetical protein
MHMIDWNIDRGRSLPVCGSLTEPLAETLIGIRRCQSGPSNQTSATSMSLKNPGRIAMRNS